MLAWDDEDDRVISVRLPFWLLRYGDDIDINLNEQERFDRLELTVDDRDHHGPELVLDHHEPGVARLLVWTE